MRPALCLAVASALVLAAPAASRADGKHGGLGQVVRATAQAIAEARADVAPQHLAAALVLLAVVGGYLRLEEMTRGFYTGLLRVAAVALLVLAGVGLWMLH